jgi:hypothetical protein
VMQLFKQLTEEEKREYREWAWENYEPLSEIKGIWHPVVQAECALINQSHDALGTLMGDLTALVNGELEVSDG